LLAINKSEKYLGITIDYRLNFVVQITLKLFTAKISRSIGVLYKLRHNLDILAV